MIHYICGYSTNSTSEKRIFSPAGASKMEYIFGCFGKLGRQYRVYSTCQVKSPKFVGKKRSKISFTELLLQRIINILFGLTEYLL